MRRLIVMVLAFAMLATACSGGSTPDDGDTQTPSVNGPQAGVLRMNSADPSTLDPAFCGDTGCAPFVSEIFSGLMTPILQRNVTEGDNERFCRSADEFSDEDLIQMGFDPTDPDARQRAADEDICLMPDIAADWPTKTINEDGTVTFTFKIREDIMFHNGRQLTAEDVKWSWERAANPRLGSSTFELYLTDIVGAWERFRNQADEISGVQVVDEFTLEVTIDGDKPYWIWNLAYPTTFVVDQVQADPVKGLPNWTANPNGTGPFKLDEYIPGHRLVLVKNDAYYLGDVLLDRAEFNLAGGSTLTKYEAGELDVAGIGLADIDRVRNPADPLNADLVEGRNELGTYYIGFNMNDPAVDDVYLRLALAEAVQREQIASVVIKDAVVPAYSFTPPGLPGYTPPTDTIQRADADDPAERDAQWQAKLEAAKAYLAQSDYDGSPITLTVSGQAANTADYIQSIVETWRTDLGVDVVIEQAGDFQTYQRDLRQGNLQMYVVGWIADYPDPYDFLDLKLHGDRSAANNEVRYDNPEFNELLLKARTEQDPETRMALYEEAERLMLEEAPVIVLFHPKNSMLVQSYVDGLGTTPMVMPRLRFVTVTPGQSLTVSP